MLLSQREIELKRKTSETNIKININLDGTGEYNVNTGIGFFDHMLESFAKHGFFDLDINVNGDINIDDHHTIEDVGILLGQAFDMAVNVFLMQ
jgi:imidazoleglycerol-phosphate dehydratase